jgi:hypothetical protein
MARELAAFATRALSLLGPFGFGRAFQRFCLCRQNSVSRQQRPSHAETGSSVAGYGVARPRM